MVRSQMDACQVLTNNNSIKLNIQTGEAHPNLRLFPKPVTVPTLTPSKRRGGVILTSTPELH